MTSVNNLVFAEQAKSEKYTGIKYDDLDCQGFVEQVLKDCGVRKQDGSCYNWRGVNSMWRNAFTWKGTIEEAIKKFGDIPLGAWLVMWADDGGEKERGYFDGQGNAKHVGIYVGGANKNEEVRDSTRTTKKPVRNGVGYRSIAGFNYVCLPFMIDYTGNDLTVNKPEKPDRESALAALETIKLYILGG